MGAGDGAAGVGALAEGAAEEAATATTTTGAAAAVVTLVSAASIYFRARSAKDLACMITAARADSIRISSFSCCF